MLRSVRPRTPSPLLAALALPLLLLHAGSAEAQSPTPPAAPQSATAPAAAEPPAALPQEGGEPPLRFGLMLDVGVPDGIGAAAVMRPLEWLRLNAGVVTNTVGFGVRAGASLAPFRSLVTPSLNVDLGHYFKADYSKLPERFGSAPSTATASLRDVGYTFGSASLGLELGSQRGLSFFLRAGLSYWDFSEADAEEALRDAADDPTLTATPVSLRLSSPSVKLGFTLFL